MLPSRETRRNMRNLMQKTIKVKKAIKDHFDRVDGVTPDPDLEAELLKEFGFSPKPWEAGDDDLPETKRELLEDLLVAKCVRDVYGRRAAISPMHRDDAAAATWICRRVTATPRPRRGCAVEPRRRRGGGVASP